MPTKKQSKPKPKASKASSEIERNVKPKTFAKLLTRIANALESDKQVSVTIKGNRVYLPKNARLSVVHEHEDDEHELELQFSWKDS